MKIGKYKLPIYFNREFLKFNPLALFKRQFSVVDFFIWFPLFGFIAGFVGGLFDWNGNNGIGIFSGGYAEMFLNFLRSKTFFDLWITNGYEFAVYNILSISKGSGLELLSGWLLLGLLWYIKIYLILYIYIKIRYIFFCKPEDLTFDGVIKLWTMKLGDTESKEEIMQRVNGSWDLIQFLKRC